MKRLGYSKFVAQGGDWGAIVTELMGVQAPPELLAIHTNMPNVIPLDIDGLAFSGKPAPADLSADEKLAYERLSFVYAKGIGYGFQMGLRPQTLYGIADSPVGLAAYFLDHDARSYEMIARVFAGASEGLTRDDVLDNITLTWLTNTALSGARLYWENKGASFFAVKGVVVPTAVSVFPDELYPAPRSWAERAYPKLIHFNKLPTMSNHSQFNIDRGYPGCWTITFSNLPINMFVPETIVELDAIMTELEREPSLKVVVFQSANPEFFTAHLDVAKAVEKPGVLDLWRDFVLRLSSAPVVSIAKIRGRTRGIGNEFVLACDMRFASRQNALFGNPEVGVGLIPGGGALEWLPRLVGRSRALEFVLSADDFDADIAERYGWVNRTLDDADLSSFVDTLVRRLASFDRKTLATAKAQINRFGTPTAAELQSSNEMIFPMLAWPDAQARRGKLRDLGYGIRSDFELNFGRYLPGLEQADEPEINAQPQRARASR
jgi:enoyl-CoA hydratase/carnithine racemase